MQYIDSIIIHNFKSFKHANIKFSKGFNCIVGPNGSGKSNICDSLLFALGESSLKRMRVNNTALLINSNAKPKKEDGVKRAYVKINLEGQNPIEVARIIKSNNKMGYRLNSKKVTRQELTDVLKGYRSEINDTNIIAQGEISYMVNLHPKERRELIDIAAGIKDFNDKKDNSMKELDKVQEKMNSAHIILNERKGFLDQLEKEKEDAEKYLKLVDTIKTITYTILKNSEKQSELDFTSTISRVKTAESKKKELTALITDADLMIETYSKEKEVLAKSLNERSIELSGTNKILENINKELAVKDTQSKSLKEKLSESEKQISQSSKDKKKLNDEIGSGTKEMESSQKELNDKTKQLSTKETYEIDNSNTQISKISSNQKRIDDLYAQEESMSRQYLQSKFEIESIEKSFKNLNQELQGKQSEYDAINESINDHIKKIKELENKISKANDELKLQMNSIQNSKKLLDEIYVNGVNIREQLAIVGGGTDKLNNLIKRNIQKGFYGRAYELCTYDEKYELAINAAAISKLSYFVVDSAEIADEAIQLIKASQLGRASFIPIKDLTTKYKEENEKLDSLISHVKFDSKFERAFAYIFANTYVVESIEKAKKIGFGKGRFVTLDGEVIEQSGIISGGSKKHLQSHLMLESKMKSLEKQQNELTQQVSDLNSKLEAKRKEIGVDQTEVLNHTIEIKHLEKESELIGNEIKSAKEKAENLSSKLLQIQNSSIELDKKRNKLMEELNVLKSENELIYQTNNSDVSKSKTKIDKSEVEKLKTLRTEVESLKIKIATLLKEQELKKLRFDEIESEISAKTDENKETMKRLAILDGELIELGKNKDQLLQKIGKSDAHSQELYKKLQQQDSYLTKYSNEKGKNQGDLERVNRELIEQETRKVQIQTRINDLKAELVSYPNMQILNGQTAEELEAKRTIAKNDLERLGAVNLKAPEVYESKKKDVEEANSKLNVLANERDSIIAMINEIESKKLSIFNETLNDVNANFKKLYNYIFEGGGYLNLENPKDPFNSGLSIVINSPKNKNSNVDALSGGEKILVMIMLIFAIQSHDPMSFYIFDEIDISLDKENSKKLSKLMKEISKKSQVIVISHNDSLITAADTAIGVVHRNGESSVVGLQLTPSEIKN